MKAENPIKVNSYPFVYSSMINQINGVSPGGLITFGNVESNSKKLYNRNVLSTMNKPEVVLDIFFNYELTYSAKFTFGGDSFFVNGGFISSRNNDLVMFLKDGILYYNTDYEFKRGMAEIFKAIVYAEDGFQVKPMVTQHMNKFFYKELPVYKFKSIREMKETYRDLSKLFISLHGKRVFLQK